MLGSPRPGVYREELGRSRILRARKPGCRVPVEPWLQAQVWASGCWRGVRCWLRDPGFRSARADRRTDRDPRGRGDANKPWCVEL